MASQSNGVVLTVIGLAGGAAVGAYLTLNPEAAGQVLYGAVAVFVLCIVLGLALALRPKKTQRTSPQQPHIRLNGAADVELMDNLVHSDRPFVEGSDIVRFRGKRNRIIDK